jgi:CubicO group peptidase (beta-lactamase class C family)
VGWSATGLAAFGEFMAARATRSVVVVHDGRLLFERHVGVAPNATSDVASVQKSLVSVLLGIARDRGLVRLDQSVSSLLGPGWTGAPAPEVDAITVGHLMTMTSGLDDRLGVVAAPGATWEYVNNAYHQLHLVLERVTGRPLDAVSREWLFDPLGMTTARWVARRLRDPLGRPLNGLEISTTDLARFGLLVLRGGSWQGRSIVSSATLNESLRPSQPMNPSYGQLWWLNGQSSYEAPNGSQTPGALIPGAPADVAAALGLNDQKCYVCPSLKLVVSRVGGKGGAAGSPSVSEFDAELWSSLLAARTG